ncbi:Hypothetical protein RAK1035_0212 [Roseovarius sp. AK1035]|nr:Hypothetical protein RAK1035_0212 [Roseovarius sp. AK1035]
MNQIRVLSVQRHRNRSQRHGSTPQNLETPKPFTHILPGPLSRDVPVVWHVSAIMSERWRNCRQSSAGLGTRNASLFAYDFGRATYPKDTTGQCPHCLSFPDLLSIKLT